MTNTDGGARLDQDRSHLAPHPVAQRGIQVGEGLVEQDHLGTRRQGTRQRHALLLSPRELVGETILEPGEPHQLEDLGDPPAPLALGVEAIGDIGAAVMCGKRA